jgi:tetratricopeptide (TPR) repeat protein
MIPERHLRRLKSLAFAAALLVASERSAAQAPVVPTARPERVTERVVSLTSEGKLAEAERVLQEALSQCRRPGSAPNCALLLSFTQAYLAQQKGPSGYAEARELYSRLLVEQPHNGAVLNNLALIEDGMGHNAEAERLWQQAIASDPERGAHYALLLGDHYLGLGDSVRALQAYEQVEQALPDSDEPRRRIVLTYAKMKGTDNFDALESRGEQWERIDPSTTRAAYEVLLARWSDDPGSAAKVDRVLLKWVVLLAKNDGLGSASISALPVNPASAGVNELREYLEHPTARPPWNWWRAERNRTAATFEIARAAGRRLLGEGDDGPKMAQSCWQQAIESIPPFALIDSKVGIDGYLRVSQELASLYFDHPLLDPDGRRMSRMVELLYEGKLLAIERGDWAITQAFHTTLALIYVSRRTWRAFPGTPNFMSASYQLQAVLDDARKLERQRGFFQPLPEIKALLAKAYSETGNKAGAASMSMQAAVAYLDADFVQDSERLLEQSSSFGSSDPATAQLRKIIATRRDFGKISPLRLDRGDVPWLFEASGILTEEFLRRQRFRIYADSIGSGTHKDSELQAALDAYGLVTEQPTNLAGAGDLLRWQKIEAALLISTNAHPAPPRIIRTSVPGPGPGLQKNLPITLAGADNGISIAPQQETPLAVEILRAVGPSRINELRQYIRLRPQGLLIAPEGAGTELVPILERLRTNPNLRNASKPVDRVPPT